MAIQIIDRLLKSFAGTDTLLDVEIPRLTPSGEVTLADAVHWGRLVECNNTVTLSSSGVSDSFWCLIRNVGTAAINITSGDSLTITGLSRIDPDEVVWVLKGGTSAVVFAVNADATERVPFPPVNFVGTTASVSPTAADVADVYVFSAQGDLNLPDTSLVSVGDYYGAINEIPTANSAIFIQPFAGDTIAGEVGADALLPGNAALYVYRGSQTWQKVLDVEEQVIPNWPISQNINALNPGVDLDISGSTWASTYNNTTVTGDGTIELPGINVAAVAVGTGIRFVATGSAGIGVNVANPATETIQGQPDPNTVSPDLSIPQGQEAILFKRDTTSSQWQLFYLGPARAVGGTTTVISAGVQSWGGLAQVINQNEIQTTLDGYGYVRGENNLPEDERAILDNVQVSRGGIPTGTITSFVARANGPRDTLAEYTLTALPLTPGTYYLLVERPNEVSSVTSDGTGASITVTRVNSSFDDRNQYSVVISNVGSGATALTVNGGPRDIHHLAMSDKWTLDGADIVAHSIDVDRLDSSVVSRLYSTEQASDLATLHETILDINNSSTRRDRNAKIQTRGAWFFDEPTADAGSFPTNKAATTADITVENASAAATRLGPATTAQRTSQQLSGPSLEDGGFDVVASNGVLDLTTNLQGIVVICTVDANVLRNADEIWTINGTDVGLIVTSDNRLAIRAPRAGSGQETQTRTITQQLQDDQGRTDRYFTITDRSDSFILPAEFTDPLTGLDSVEIAFFVYENGNLAEGRQFFMDISNLAADVAEATGTITAAVTNGPTTGRYSYTASTRRINVSVDSTNWTNNAVTVKVRVRGRRDETVTISAGTTDYNIEYDIPDATRYTIAAHLFKENNLFSVQLAINGASPNEAITTLTNINPTTSAFQNPRIEFGGNGNVWNGFLQKVLVGQALPFTATTRLSNAELAAISGQYDQPFYGLISPIGAHKEVAAPGVRWQVAINNENSLPGAPAVETFTLTLEDDFGRPGLPTITSDDIRNGKYQFRVLVYETISTNEHVADLAWHDLGLVNGQADYRVRFAATIADPADNEIVVSGTQLRINHTSISSNAAFNGQTVTAALQIVVK